MFHEGQEVQYSNDQTGGRVVAARIEGVGYNSNGYYLLLDNGDYCFESEVVNKVDNE